jgi:hypothetical protein
MQKISLRIRKIGHISTSGLQSYDAIVSAMVNLVRIAEIFTIIANSVPFLCRNPPN